MLNFQPKIAVFFKVFGGGGLPSN